RKPPDRRTVPAFRGRRPRALETSGRDGERNAGAGWRPGRQPVEMREKIDPGRDCEHHRAEHQIDGEDIRGVLSYWHSIALKRVPLEAVSNIVPIGLIADRDRRRTSGDGRGASRDAVAHSKRHKVGCKTASHRSAGYNRNPAANSYSHRGCRGCKRGE